MTDEQIRETAAWIVQDAVQYWKSIQEHLFGYHKERLSLQNDARILFKSLVSQWLIENSIRAFVRSELSLRECTRLGLPSVELHTTTIHNGKGSQSSRWLNKIAVRCRPGRPRDVELVAHKATTDPAYLCPTDREFLEFIRHVAMAIDEELDRRRQQESDTTV